MRTAQLAWRRTASTPAGPTLVGGNTAESNTGSGYTIPSALSNAAPIQADDLIFLMVSTADAANGIAVAGFLPTTNITGATGSDGENFDGSARTFFRVATGSEAAGWAVTFASSGFATTYNFVVYRGVDPVTPFAPDPPTNANDLSIAYNSGANTVPANTVAILAITALTFTGDVQDDPIPSPAMALVQKSVTNSLRLFLSYFYEASVASGSLTYSGTFLFAGNPNTCNSSTSLFVLNPL